MNVPKTEWRKVPIINCRGEIMESDISGVGSYLRVDCRLHGAEIYRGMTVFLRNSCIPGLMATVQVFLSEDFLRDNKDREAILSHIMRDGDKKAWLFSYASRILEPYGEEKARGPQGT